MNQPLPNPIDSQKRYVLEDPKKQSKNTLTLGDLDSYIRNHRRPFFGQVRDKCSGEIISIYDIKELYSAILERETSLAWRSARSELMISLIVFLFFWLGTPNLDAFLASPATILVTCAVGSIAIVRLTYAIFLRFQSTDRPSEAISSLRKQKSYFDGFSWKHIFAGGPIVLSIAAVWISMTLASTSGLGDFFKVADCFGSLNKAQLLDGREWWRVLTAGVIHLSNVHLALNSALLLLATTLLSRHVSASEISVLLILGIVAASAASTLGSPRTSAGISGGILCLLGTLVAGTSCGKGWYIPAQMRIFVNVLVIEFLAFGFFAIPTLADNSAHVGGFVFGVLYGVIRKNMSRFFTDRGDNFHLCFPLSLVLFPIIALAVIAGSLSCSS